MTTKTLVADMYSWKEAAREASDLLLEGKLVALPTETVYGLACSVRCPEALAQVFAVKERPYFDPLIVHLGSVEDLPLVTELSAELKALVHRVAEKFWPGPLTLILPKHPDLPDLVTSGLDTVAVRISDHELMREVCQLTGPIAAPSANRFGRISPTSARAVEVELGGKIPLIIDAGACREGVESTIIRPEVALPGKKPVFTVLRPGPVTREKLREIGKVEKPKRPKAAPLGAEDEGVVPVPTPAPGMMSSHYAPETPLYLYDDPSEFTPEEGKKYALLSLKGDPEDAFHQCHDWEMTLPLSPGSGKVAEAAVRFFWALRQLDEAGVDAIIAEAVPTANVGMAIMDRLRKASVNH